MAKPINDSDGNPSLLSTSRVACGRWLGADWGNHSKRWSREDGFAFTVAQARPND